MAAVGDLHVACPECGETIAVPITARLSAPGEDGQFVTCEPDLTDVWAHAWTHETRTT